MSIKDADRITVADLAAAGKFARARQHLAKAHDFDDDELAEITALDKAGDKAGAGKKTKEARDRAAVERHELGSYIARLEHMSTPKKAGK